MKKAIYLFAVMFLAAFVANAQKYVVNPDESVLKWNGKKVTGEHYGKIDLKEGSFEISNNKVVDGKFVINMQTITNDDLEGEWNQKLVGHLKSDDFFSVATYPEALLVLKESTKMVDGKAKVKGHLTIKGKTHPVEFEGHQNGNTFSAKITVDRTLYDVRYGSNKFFDNLGDKAIYDDFTLNVKLHTKSEMANN